MRKRALVTGTTVLALLAAAGPAAASQSVAPVKGVVVGSSHGVVLVAAPGGAVKAIRGQARIGMLISAANGRIAVLGRSHAATVRGVVVRHTGSLTFLSASRHMLVVHTARKLQDGSPSTTTQPGAVVQETVGFDDQGDLQEQAEHQVGQMGQVQIQATIAAVGTGTVTLTVNGQSLTIPLPAGLTLPANLVGTTVTLNVSFAGGNAVAQGEDDQGDDDGGNRVAPGTTTIPLGTPGTMPPQQQGGDGHGGRDGGGND